MPEQKLTDDLFEVERQLDEEVEVISQKPVSYLGDSWKRLKKNTVTIIGLALIVIIIFLALAGPYMNSHEFDEQNLQISKLPPKVPLLEHVPVRAPWEADY